MLIHRMYDRVGQARVVAKGFVEARRLEFHKRGVDGSGKANAMHTGDESDRIWGVVYELSRRQQSVLDKFESLGIGYEHHDVQVQLSGGSLDAYLYAALHDFIDDTLQPYHWYHSFVVQGARQHRLPGDYLEQLLQVRPKVDPDSDRQQRNERILTKARTES